MEISFLIAAVAAIVLILFLYILFTKEEKNKTSRQMPTDNTKNLNFRRTDPIETRTQAILAPPAATDKKEYAGDLTFDELGTSNIYGDLRKFTQSGIEAVLVPAEDYSDAVLPPLTKEAEAVSP